MSDETPPGDALVAGRPRPRHRMLTGAVVTLLVLLAAAVVASFWKLPDYAVVPGTALDAVQLVTVPKAQRHSHGGSIYLTDVELVQLRAIDYLWYRYVDSNAQVVPIQQETGPATQAQYVTQGTIDMANARQAATVVALDKLGYHVRAVPAGVIVYQPDPGSPAASALADDDVIVAVDGHPVTDFASLVAALGPAPAPGREVALTVHTFGKSARSVVRLHLGVDREGKVRGQLVGGCFPTGRRSTLPELLVGGKPHGCIGLFANVPGGSETAYRTVGLPFQVSLDPAGIIGPSAGLAYTLALIQQLDRFDLTGGRRVAATGTMSVDGQVGDVGGVAQKTVAVRNAGATVFFVPVQEKAVATAHAGPALRVFAVSSVSQVLADLSSLGAGRISR